MTVARLASPLASAPTSGRLAAEPPTIALLVFREIHPDGIVPLYPTKLAAKAFQWQDVAA